ncbi:MAG TPA: methyltransferase [Pseudolysinimonas sp.]|nr:methyltransferase [Pseudolysinimonas sp.]
MTQRDPHAIAALRADLTAAGYTVDGLTALWGPEAGSALERGNRVPARRRLAQLESATATLATAWILGLPVSEAHLSRALPTLGVDGAIGLELFERAEVEGRGEAGHLYPLVDLRPYAFLDARGAGEWWIASDLGELAVGVLRTDHVLGVGGASMTLSGLIMPGHIGRALDLGTGCGIQALHLAREAEHVVATDISERALDFARLNAALNGVDSIEFRLGSLFEPVAGETFDRIVSNPPFVITPRGADVPEYEYRDGGAVGDGLLIALIADLGDHLEPGGVAQLLGNWEYRHGSPGLDAVGARAQAAGLDAWVIEREVADPARYAETWIRDGGTRTDAADFERLVGAWLDDFEHRGVESIGFGYLQLRRPLSGVRSLHRLERVDAALGTAGSGLGAQVAATLAAHDAQRALDDRALAAARLTVAPDVTEERSHWPGQEHPTVITLRQGGGLRREVRAGTGLAAVVGACDGELQLGAIISAVAGLVEVDETDLSAELLPEIRELLVTGMLRFE